ASTTLANAADVACRQRRPLIAIINSSGADVFEGVAALHGWGTAARALAACSGVVPVAIAVTGPAVSGPALLLGLGDLVAMTEDSYAFVSGPAQVAGMTGVRLDAHALGGSNIHSRTTGVATFVVPDEATAVALLSDALSYLPSHLDEE